MAEAVVSSVGQTIANLLIDEAKFLWGVEGKVEDLYRELRLIRCLLRDADTRGEHNQAVGECVAQLRDVAYDAEDVIERYTLRVELKKGQYITRACACFLANSTCLQVHAVGTEIEGLKSRISNLRMSMLAFGAQPANKDELKRTKASMLKRYYDHYEEDFIGRKHSVEALVKELSNGGETHRVICIWGMGGLGKTSLAKKVVAHDKVKNNFDNLAWVYISQEYCVKDILKKIFLKLEPNQRDDELKNMKEEELSTAVCDTQKKKKCLVVLDDIWTNKAWDSLRLAFPIKETKSKLLITTRNREVAEHIDSKGLIYELQRLSNQESWDLLKKKAFPRTKGLVVEISSDGPGVGQGTATGEVVEGIARQLEIEEQLPVITQDMKRIRDELLKKCGGLPLAIIVLGGLLAVNEWKTVHEKINLHLGDKSDVFKMLALSYDDLPWHLKPCFLYLGSFSEDAKIPAMQVLRMWIAEGFVSLDENEEGETPVEDIAEQYLVELINRGMVQVQFNLSGKIKTCYLHDLMRDLCLTKARQERFLSILNIQQDDETKDCSPSMATKVKSTYKTRRLSLNMSAKGNMIPRAKQIGRTMLNLRTLTSSGVDVNMWKQLQYVFINCKFLRVLKLERVINTRGNLPKSVGDLVHLKFLSLAKCWFKGLPQSLGNLINMEFLDIHMDRFIWVIVPNVLWKMRKLRYLRLPTCFVVKKRFCGDQRKLRLNTLNSLRILKNLSLNMCDVNSLSKLTNLQKLTMIGRCDSSNTMVPLYGEFNSGDFPVISYVPGSSPLSEGELNMTLSWCHNCELFLCGKIEKLPKYESLPQQLSKLVLYRTQLEEDPMKILEKLKHLIVLMLGYDAFLGKKMICSAGGFSQLKHLVLRGLKDLEEWRVDEGAMPQLSRLAISSCPKLTVPGGVPRPHDDFDDLPRLLRKVG